MTLTNPLKFEVKSDNVLELSTAAFELVRGALVTRFNEDPELERSTSSREAYYCDTVTSKVDLNHTVESEVMKVFSGKTRCAKSTYKRSNQLSCIHYQYI